MNNVVGWKWSFFKETEMNHCGVNLDLARHLLKENNVDLG